MSRLALLAALALALAACGGNEAATPGQTEDPVPVPTETEPAATTGFAVYFTRGEAMTAVYREVPETEAVGAAAVQALLEGPTADERALDYASNVPPGTRLLGLRIDDGTAVVDLSREFETGGGTLAMTARLAELTFTLTQFPSVDRVRVELDGEPVEVFGGEGILLDEPLTRERFADLTPPILVDRPAAGEPVESPLRVRGSASVFEATVHLRLEADGRALDERFTTAAEGAPGRGAFEAEIPFEAEGPATLVLFSPSAEDDTEQHRVEIPLTLGR